ncbi:MAG: serine protein kinase RIO [Thermoplasmata archaeon]|nr:MAG: serine protein kinase RIO [Thermoplasmata archaeon]
MEIKEKIVEKIDRELQELKNRIGIDRKTLDEVFDRPTLLAFGKLISDGIIEYVDFPISTGKEANVFRAVTPDGKLIAVKVYRIATSNFKRMIYYIRGDPRFAPVGRSKREVIYQWVRKEMKNLERLAKINVPAPKPIKSFQNILVMQYLGSKSTPAPLIKDVELENPEETCEQIIDYVRKMFLRAKLVHSDLSEYNILYYRKKPYLIDLAQGVILDHPMALDFLRRDVANIVRFFRKYGVNRDEKRIYDELVGMIS